MAKSIVSHIRVALALIILLVLIILAVTSQWFWKVIFPMPYKDIVWEHAQESGVDPYLIMALIRTESNFIPRAISRSGALGLMQLMPETAEWIACQLEMKTPSEEKLYEPSTNIRLGTYYFKHLLERYDGNVALALAAYNSGMGRVSEWLKEGIWDGMKESSEDIPYEETRHFVSRVLRSYEIYGKLYR